MPDARVATRSPRPDGSPRAWVREDGTARNGGSWQAARRGATLRVVAGFPAGTVTFLFTDIEGSARLWEAHPEAMKAALARHERILRDAVVRHQGLLVKTTGDGGYAVFARAQDAVAAAVRAQVGLVGERWGEVGELRVRMGLHTGTAELREDDYFGPVLNRAARVFQVAHAELGSEFPALRSMDAMPGNLPRQVTTFVGRVHDLESLARLVCERPLVTLTGVGGVGKTRLALQVAAEVVGEFPG